MRQIANKLKLMYPELNVREKYDATELILKRGKMTLHATITEPADSPYALIIPDISATIVNNNTILMASYWKNVKKLFTKHVDMIFSYVYEPYKHYPLVMNFDQLYYFFDGKIYEWLSKNFKMPARVIDLWMKELSNI